MNDKDVLKAHRREVVQYWERRRWLYLVTLVVVTIIGYFQGQERAHAVALGQIFDLGSLMILSFLFVAANACYSVVYLFEFLVMGTRSQEVFHHYRWLLLGAGCLLGMAIAYECAYGLAWMMDVGF